ncbi:hypothetical protein PEDI_11480 [Persicobacter diffluens]|uniref:Uncharacterized protein n=1 Tax=Persicobacter diffluens TaxID=981 RepID=A0AAN5AKM9_9BACT|nr:hypothetical protein PEDI_11480 [Persicobacter diffluens]
MGKLVESDDLCFVDKAPEAFDKNGLLGGCFCPIRDVHLILCVLITLRLKGIKKAFFIGRPLEGI